MQEGCHLLMCHNYVHNQISPLLHIHSVLFARLLLHLIKLSFITYKLPAY